MHSVNAQTKYGNFNWNIFHTGVIRDPLICISKIHQFVRKNSQISGVNRAKKAYQCIVYTPMRSSIASNPRVYIFNLHLKNSSANSLFAQYCARGKQYLHNSKNWPRSPLDRSNFVCLSSALRILGFHNNRMENTCRISRVVLKRCINVIGRNAWTLAWLTK